MLTPSEQTFLDQVLAMWEKESSGINTFKCTFTLWEYNAAFGPNGGNGAKSEARGEIKYKAPDHGAYRVTELGEWSPAAKKFVPIREGLDHWVCNGKAIYEFAHAKKQLIERKIPPALQGKAIADGPIPFIFGAKADKLRQRYFLRDVTPSDWVKKGIWLEAWPRFQNDAANFEHAELILTQPDFLPFALQIYLPGGKNRRVYQFDDRKKNGWLDAIIDFREPSTPLGWKRLVEPAPGDPAGQPPAARQASRPQSKTSRTQQK